MTNRDELMRELEKARAAVVRAEQAVERVQADMDKARDLLEEADSEERLAWRALLEEEDRDERFT